MLLSTAFLLVPLGAAANSPTEEEPLIYGGTTVETCGWPTTVAVRSGGGLCTGTLVSPEIVIFAAHCGAGNKQISFGESINGPARQVGTEFCQTNPQYAGANHDFAFCKLAEPVVDIQIVPILMGCETGILVPGGSIVIAGFGEADNGPTGIKREVVTQIGSVGGDEALLGGAGKGACHGDSGGPAFIQLGNDAGGDDTWRVFGVTSRGVPGCLNGATFGLMHTAVEWIEGAAGVDITPCGDAQGNWDPTVDCGFFPQDPGHGHGPWPSCGEGPLGGFSSICGDPAGGPDDDPPTVELTAPESGSMFMSDPDSGSALVDMSAIADDGDGWGIQDVRLIINGDEIMGTEDPSEPYEWVGVLQFPSGQYTVSALATDRAGHSAESEPVYFGVDMDAPTPPDPDDDGTGDGTGSGDGPGGTGNPGLGEEGEAGGGKGCGCSADNGWGSSGAGLLGLLGLLMIRRRS
jgi:MYXO-CTERM domain-containing protein